MSPSLLKMWISLAAMGLMALAIISIYFSRYKLKGVFRFIIAFVAYTFMVVSGIMILFVVLSGPTS